jgi:hypothetical protein
MATGIKVAVTGSKRFRDVKLLHRALEAFHRKHPIGTLITGDRAGVEEMAYYWAVAKHIREIITVPVTMDMTGHFNYESRNRDILQYYTPFAIIAFPPQIDGATQHLVYTARDLGYKVWEVPTDWR